MTLQWSLCLTFNTFSTPTRFHLVYCYGIPRCVSMCVQDIIVSARIRVSNKLENRQDQWAKTFIIWKDTYCVLYSLYRLWHKGGWNCNWRMISKDSVVCQDSASFIKHDSQWRNQTCVVFLILEPLKLGLLFFQFT